MITITGKYNTVVCYADALDEKSAAQLQTLCGEESFAGSRIRIMPDVHAGVGCTIGTTMTITDKVVPGMVGVDIGCGMETVKLAERELCFDALDKLIRCEIPCGRDIRLQPHARAAEISGCLAELRCAEHVHLERALKSVGTLGGGNHFIEVDASGSGELYLVVHSGSRYLGKEVAEHYQREGLKALCGGTSSQIAELIASLKAEGRSKEIAAMLSALKAEQKSALSAEPTCGAYVCGKLFDDYIHDMRTMQRFALLNRRVMADIILQGLSLTASEAFSTIHNYIDTDSMILRKGAVSAKEGEKLLIPINMRDGSLICIGKGNPEWNFSAPHGAGRLMSRSKARASLSIDEYRREMSGVFSSCVNRSTLDESPMAYKSMDSIVEAVEPSVRIAEIIKPFYNFKAAED